MKPESAIAVIIDEETDEILLGKSNADDDRNGLWCFPGGGINEGEDIKTAAKREAYQETGIWTEADAIAEPIINPAKPKVAFVLLHPVSGEINPNHEFDEMKWFKISKLPKDIMESNREILKHFYKTMVERLIQKVRGGREAAEVIEEAMSRKDMLSLSVGSTVKTKDNKTGKIKKFVGTDAVLVQLTGGNSKKSIKIKDLTLVKA